MLEFNKINSKTPFLNYKKNLWDLNIILRKWYKLLYGIIINYKKLQSKANYIIF